MNKFQSYLEWLPERFAQARAEGVFNDVKEKTSQKKEQPEWFIRHKKLVPLMKSEDYKLSTDLSTYNAQYIGIIATQDQAWLFDRSNKYHQRMIVTLMDKGYLPMRQACLNYQDHKINQMPFIALEFHRKLDVISISVAYVAGTHEDSMIKKFDKIIQKLKNSGKSEATKGKSSYIFNNKKIYF